MTVLAVALRSRGKAWLVPVAWAALLGVNHRSHQYFVENRPDMTALLLATLAICAIGYGQERRRGWLVLLGSAFLVAGFFFKQTALVFAVVPLVALGLRGRWPDRPAVALALIPLATCGVAILALWAVNPVVYHYMVVVPGAYAIDWGFAAKRIWQLLIESPLFLFLVGEWIGRDRASFRTDARMVWIVAVLTVALPSGAIAYAKFGGAVNSLLPALLAIIAFCALRLPTVWERSAENAAFAPRGGCSACFWVYFCS